MTTDVEAAIRSIPLWYHTIEVAPGLTTPGWFDLRPIVPKMPWPDVTGKRCLDIGTYDGYLAFELERRGASEVVATDIADHRAWDWPVAMRDGAPERLAELAGPEKGSGFRIVKQLLGSAVEKVEINVYDLSPERVGSFDVVVCGSLMLHLRDPLRAIDAIRSVCSGVFLSAEAIDLTLTAMHPRRPVFAFDGISPLVQWATPNAAAHRQMIQASGFEVERSSRPYTIPFGVAHPARPTTLKHRRREMLQRALAGGTGVPHTALLARRS